MKMNGILLQKTSVVAIFHKNISVLTPHVLHEAVQHRAVVGPRISSVHVSLLDI